jgi:DNA polymerase-3 subunit epsilon
MKPLICFDIEATGVDTAKDRIVQIAFCEIAPSDLDDTYVPFDRRKLLINPEVSIPAEATAIHGITNDDIYGSPTFRDVSLVLHDQFKDCDLAGFNISNFDVPLLWEEFYRVGIEWDLSNTRIIDAGTLFKRREERTLAAALKFYCGRELVDAHDAMNDVLATVDVLTAQVERYQLMFANREMLERESNYEEKRVDLAGKIILKDGVPTWNFGKVKGKPVVEELGFAYWVLDRDFPENLKMHIHRIIDEHNRKAESLLEVAGDGDPF